MLKCYNISSHYRIVAFQHCSIKNIHSLQFGICHNHMHPLIQVQALTPHEYRHKGMGIDIVYGFHDTPFGECMIANTTRGICMLDFVDDKREFILQRLRDKWANAHIRHHQNATAALIAPIFRYEPKPVKILPYGTAFQLKIWNTLIEIPFGQQSTYSAIAQQIKQAKAARAVGSALAQNHIAYLIPCHRVLRVGGGLANYKWSKNRKAQIIEWEKNVMSTSLAKQEHVPSRIKIG